MIAREFVIVLFIIATAIAMAGAALYEGVVRPHVVPAIQQSIK